MYNLLREYRNTTVSTTKNEKTFQWTVLKYKTRGLNRWISVAPTCPNCREKIVYYKKVRLKLYYPYTLI